MIVLVPDACGAANAGAALNAMCEQEERGTICSHSTGGGAPDAAAAMAGAALEQVVSQERCASKCIFSAHMLMLQVLLALSFAF